MMFLVPDNNEEFVRQYTLARSNRKTLGLYIKNGKLEVRAPLFVPKEKIDAFVRSKEKWIAGKLPKSYQDAQQRANFSLNYGDTVLYLGKEHPIVARLGDYIGFDDDLGQFFMPPHLSPEHIKAAVVQIYRILAKHDLTNKVTYYAKHLNVVPMAVKINGAKTRWGSCSSKMNLNFSWRLIMADEATVDYVVVHELAHLIEMGHNERFWAIVASVLPDYKERQKQLKELMYHLRAENWEDC
ncbi:MAG: M48 family metallopeptidase [Coriobacteriia bacterium]|nr:M48 family metallopeptidase [Coriobacteriia bacterium]